MEEPKNIESLTWEKGYTDGYNYMIKYYKIDQNGNIPHIHPQWLKFRATNYECGFPEGLISAKNSILNKRN